MSLGFLNIRTQEMVLIVIVILLLFGGKKLPELARGLGGGYLEFKATSGEVKRAMFDEIKNVEKAVGVTVEDTPTTEYRAQPRAYEINQRRVVGPGDEEETQKEFPKF